MNHPVLPHFGWLHQHRRHSIVNDWLVFLVLALLLVLMLSRTAAG